MLYGQGITYDAIGNPTSYMGSTMIWSNGRELSSIVDGNKTICYTYTTDGIRLSKTVNGITTKYVLDGSKILSETTGNETLNYYYDSNGILQQIGYKKGTAEEEYYFVARNGQGDVIAIYNASDSKLVGTYAYDVWGKVLSVDAAGNNSDLNGILEKNPFRYRGYYYDRETGLYYLFSRYYDSETCRFINADGYVSTGQGVIGNNMFAYCNNNPINLMDLYGATPTTNKDANGKEYYIYSYTYTTGALWWKETETGHVYIYINVDKGYFDSKDFSYPKGFNKETDLLVADFTSNDDPNMLAYQAQEVKKKYRKKL